MDKKKFINNGVQLQYPKITNSSDNITDFN